MKFLGSGIAVSLIVLVLSLVLGKPELAVNILLIIGIIPIVISALFSGVFLSGDRIRSNYSGEENFQQKMSRSSKLFWLGIPCLVIAFAVSFFTK